MRLRTGLCWDDEGSWKWISSIWNAIDGLDHLDGTEGGVVIADLRNQVTDALYQEPPNLRLAERLTAIALAHLEDKC